MKLGDPRPRVAPYGTQKPKNKKVLFLSSNKKAIDEDGPWVHVDAEGTYFARSETKYSTTTSPGIPWMSF
jgi:hypothetical protein